MSELKAKGGGPSEHGLDVAEGHCELLGCGPACGFGAKTQLG